jgi:hypothetical protein
MRQVLLGLIAAAMLLVFSANQSEARPWRYYGYGWGPRPAARAYYYGPPVYRQSVYRPYYYGPGVYYNGPGVIVGAPY